MTETYGTTEPCEHCGSVMCALSSPDRCLHTSKERKSLDAPVADKQVRRPHRKKAVSA